MAIWAIGDIQGCYYPLKELLKKIDFNPKKDKLWIAGDLVNRGKNSLEVLEYLYSIRDSIVVVLGNHDISLISIYYGLKKSNPTLDPILNSSNRDKLINWLKNQKILHIEKGFCLSHAGIAPDFSLPTAYYYAKRLENKLQTNPKEWLEEVSKTKDILKLSDAKREIEKEKYAIDSFIRMRFTNLEDLDFKQKEPPNRELKEKNIIPWFDSPYRKKINKKIVFGHWSALGFYQNEEVIALDTGCVWQRKLTAIKISNKDLEVVNVECK